jgi:hypothetical protein
MSSLISVSARWPLKRPCRREFGKWSNEANPNVDYA